MVSEEKTTAPKRTDAIALRLRESDEDSCLWRLRCGDAIVGGQVQRVLDT